MGNAACKPLWTFWFGRKEVRILMMGLDAAGKTTTLYKLKLGEIVTTIPTIGFNVEVIEHNGVEVTVWDVGVRSKSRSLYRHYYANTDAVVFVVDCSDRDRFQEALDDVLLPSTKEDELAGIPFLILANKQDLSTVMTPGDIAKAIRERGYLQNRKWAVFGTSATSKTDGLHDALGWLTDVLVDREKEEYINGIIHADREQKSTVDMSDVEVKTDKPKWNYYTRIFDVYKWFGKS